MNNYSLPETIDFNEDYITVPHSRMARLCAIPIPAEHKELAQALVDRYNGYAKLEACHLDNLHEIADLKACLKWAIGSLNNSDVTEMDIDMFKKANELLK